MDHDNVTVEAVPDKVVLGKDLQEVCKPAMQKLKEVLSVQRGQEVQRP